MRTKYENNCNYPNISLPSLIWHNCTWQDRGRWERERWHGPMVNIGTAWQWCIEFLRYLNSHHTIDESESFQAKGLQMNTTYSKLQSEIPCISLLIINIRCNTDWYLLHDNYPDAAHLLETRWYYTPNHHHHTQVFYILLRWLSGL